VPDRHSLHPLANDLDHILRHTLDLWRDLRGQRLFLTGGSGFFGCWLLESLAWANDRLALGIEATVLTRHPEAFLRKAPHLAGHPAIRLHEGDVRDFDFPSGSFGLVVHGAAESSTDQNEANPVLMLDTIVDGTRRVLEFARRCQVQSFLFISSGAVYGRQPRDLTHVPEDFVGGPDPLNVHSAYGEGKRLAELLCACYAQQHGLPVKIARGFAFVGPYLPLDSHFAVGNFIRDGLRGGPILVRGDGTPSRSYLYSADLAIWLWTVLLRGAACRPYNLGSEDALSIAELAERVAGAFSPALEVRVCAEGTVSHDKDRYVPSTERAARELGLRQTISLSDALARTIRFHRRSYYA
jgi:nucleoside-diphosphate-sugar epimerase